MKHTMKLPHPLVTAGSMDTLNIAITGVPTGLTFTEITLGDGKDDAPTDAEISTAIASIKKAHGGHVKHDLDTQLPDIPLPGNRIFDATVVASTWLYEADDDHEFDGALLMLLNPLPPYYSLVDVEHHPDGWRILQGTVEDYPNINPATELYAQRGGDY